MYNIIIETGVHRTIVGLHVGTTTIATEYCTLLISTVIFDSPRSSMARARITNKPYKVNLLT